MRMIFGIAGLLIVLAVIGVIAKQQLKAANDSLAKVPGVTSGSGGNVAEKAREIQQNFGKEVSKALEQGARKEGAQE